MMKFIRGRSAHVNAERLKLQKELFEFNQTLFHGFLHRPSALAYDKKLNILAIGTRDGSLRLYGKSGVEFQTTIEHERKIDSIHFIDNTSQLIVKCEDNSIHLYEIPNNLQADAVNLSELQLIKSFDHFVVDLENDERSTSNRITSLTIHSSNARILIATEDGNIHFLNTKKFNLEQNSISVDKVQAQIPKDQSTLLGAAEQILEHPIDADRLLIGYNRGQLILWNLETEKLEKFYSSGQQLESICWSSDGQEFISSHNDGSYIVWSINDNIQSSQQAKILYGPFPCKPITKIYAKSNENLTIFSGGMPRQLHGERHTVSIIQGLPDSAKHQVLDLTSKVIDFVVLEQQQALIILAEEELVAIDLNDSEWSQFKLPYLYSVHSSPITFSQIYSDISDGLVEKLKKIGLKQNVGKYSFRDWPVQGGYLKEKTYSPNNVILITGHENGCVRIWNISDCAMSPLCIVNTAKYFGTEDDIAPIDGDEQDDEWPPFKKVGVFDPYSDDPRLGIRRIVLCPKTFNLLVAGTAGQVIVFELKDESTQLQLSRETVDLVSGLDFIWKSHECLPLVQDLLSIEAGYQPKSIIQFNPPASITALALDTEWNLFSAGTTHGFAVFSYELNKLIAYKCTLNPAEVSTVSGSGNLITRKKSFRKSLRESFRRLRKGRSMRLTKKAGDKSSPVTSPTKSKGSKVDVSESRPLGAERQIEAKTEDGIGSVVRYLYFANAPIINQGQFQHTLWAGTNAGNVFIYLINNEIKDESSNDVKNTSATSNTATTAENQTENQTAVTTTAETVVAAVSATASPASTSNEKNNEIEESPIEKASSSTNLTCILTKEIQLKHHAPVIFIQIVDSTGLPIEERTINEEQQTESGIVRVLICSEEQFKLFNLPTLKPYCKFKLTAQEGSKSRRISVSKFVSKSDPNYSEYSVVNITNQGEIGVFNILDLKKQLNSKCTKKEDMNAIFSLVFARNGEGIYLNSPSEFSRFSLSAQRSVKPNCLISETPLDKIVIEVEKVEEEPTEAGEQANQSQDSSNQQTEQSTEVKTATSADKTESSAQPSSIDESNQQQAAATDLESKEKPKNADNQTPSVKVTEVKKDQEQTDSVKIVEEHIDVKLLETIRDCSVKQLCSTPETIAKDIKTEIKETKIETKPISNGVKNVVTNVVEVHHHLNGNKTDLNNGLNGKHTNDDLKVDDDEDEGEGKSIEELEKSKSDDNLKSNGTPTSGIEIVDDEDDSFLEDDTINDLNNLNSTVDNSKTHSHNAELLKGYANNETEIKTLDSANNSTMDVGDITIDSVKEWANENNCDLKFNKII